MAFSSHIVQELHLDLTVSERQKAFSIQQRASQLASNRLIGALERILSRYADDQLVFQIDKLEVDIGRLMEENWEEHFLQLLQIRLDKELKNRLQYIPGEAVQAQVLEKEERNLEAWFFLLEKGYLPWWAQHSEKSINEKEVLAALVGNTTKQVLLKELCKEAPIYRRLVFHYSDHFLTKLMEILYHSIPKQLEEFKVIIIAYVQAKEPSSLKRNLTRFRLWKHILERVVDGKIEASAQRIDTTRLLLAKMSIKPKHLLNWIDFSLYKGNKSLGSTDSLKFWQEMFLELSKVDNPSSPNHLAFQTEKGELDQPTTNPPLLPDLPEQVAE
ncbi:MAG: contractile injection system tape measure protein, partial [Bacteroidota bacterium]